MFALVGAVLLFLLPSPWNLVGFTCALVLFLGEVLFWHRRVRGQPKKVGAQMLVGQIATVISTCRPDGQVQVSGEIWAARCSGGADQGDTVTVVGGDGLTLVVETSS
jgi:membrane-bound serine protease (ClpP class)